MITPYYQDSKCTIYHGDCRELLPEIGSVDLVLTDPPYGETSLHWDRVEFSWIKDVRVSAGGSLWCFGSFRYLVQALAGLEAEGWKLAQEIVWEKQNGTGMHKDRFRRVHELALHCYPKDVLWRDVYKEAQYSTGHRVRKVERQNNPQHWGKCEAAIYHNPEGKRLERSVQYVRNTHHDARHPTQKPTELLTKLLRYSCPKDGLVLDPFMGSGSTLRAAKDAGRRAIGIELEEEYCEIAASRLGQEVFDFAS